MPDDAAALSAPTAESPPLAPLLVGARAAARLCGISPASWHRLRSAGKIGPAEVRLGGRVLWRVAELAEWCAAGAPDRKTWQALQVSENGYGRK